MRELSRRFQARRRGRSLLLCALLVGIPGCSWQLIAVTAKTVAGGTAEYVVELVNDQLQLPSLAVYSVAYVPAGWQLMSASYTSTAVPASGAGAEISDPGFTCTTGSLPSPGAGRRAVFVHWGTFTVVNPQTSTGTFTFRAGQTTGAVGIDLYVVLRGGSDTVCSAALSTSTEVVPPIFADGFESGDVSRWSASTQP